MTHPIDTTPEAIAALLDELRTIGCHENGDARCTCGIGQDAADLIQALTAERDRQYDDNADRIASQAKAEAERDAALIRAERSERCEVAAHDAANTAIRQRDEARAQVAVAIEMAAKESDMAAALAHRRAEGAEKVGHDTTACIEGCVGDECVSLARAIRALTPADAAAALARRDAAMRNEGRRQAAGIVEAECTRVLSKQDGILPEVDRTLRMMCILLPDISASILAALEPEGEE